MAGIVNGDGSVLGRSLSDLLARTLTQHAEATADANIGLRTQFAHGLMEHLEGELRPTMQRVFGFILESDSAPDHLKALAEAAAGPTHQADLLLQLVAMVGVAFGGFISLSEPLMQRLKNEMWVAHPDVPLSPADAASATVRNVATDIDLAYEAKRSGMAAGQFEVMKGLAGEPPGPMQLVDLWRRQLIDTARLDHGIRQSRVRDEWIDTYHALRYLPLGVPELVQAVVEGHMEYLTAMTIADGQGVRPEDFGVMYETAGNPPGVQDVGDLLNRGLMSYGDAEQAIRESRYKPKYTEALLALREQLPPREAIVLMIERGVITQPQAVTKLMQLGYNAENATFLAQEALNRKHTPERDLAKGEVTQLYGAGVITNDQAVGFLASLGYDTNEAEFVLGLVDTAKQRQAIQAAISRVHALYVAYRINRTDASNDLDQLKVNMETRDGLLHVWDLERDANARDLTLTDLRSFVRQGLITLDVFNARLVQLGYSQTDADLLTEFEAGRA